MCPSVRGPDTDEIGYQDVGGVVDRTADAGGQEEGDRLGGHEWGHRGAGGPGIIPPVVTGPGKTGQTGGRTSHVYCPAHTRTHTHTAQSRLTNVNRLPLQPRKASATCSSATAAASSGFEDWSARSPRQRDSDPSHSDLSNTPSSNNKPPSPAGAALILSKPPSPCAPGTTDTHTHTITVSNSLPLKEGRPYSPFHEEFSEQRHLVYWQEADECQLWWICVFVGPSNQSRHHLEYRAIMQEMSPTAFGESTCVAPQI